MLSTTAYGFHRSAFWMPNSGGQKCSVAMLSKIKPSSTLPNDLGTRKKGKKGCNAEFHGHTTTSGAQYFMSAISSEAVQFKLPRSAAA